MSLRIVVVDDNVDLVDSLLSVLEHLGHEAYGATRGDDGVRLVEEKRPDVALIDVGMPGISGMDLLSSVKELTSNGDPAPTDVIIVTGKSAESVAVEALRRGAYDYFRKPFSFDAMTFTVRRDAVDIRATARLTGKTGVEMEALTAVSVAALTLYDMCKAVDKGMAIGGIRVVEKRKA